MPYKPALSEPIAVVASSCRFTGGTTSPSKLWDLLKEPTDLTRPVPKTRFSIKAFSHPEGDYHGTTDAPNSYFLDDEQDPRAFDTGFFGIAPKEAEAVDPQQRLLLETVYEALEASGYKLPEWTGKDVAVYVGAMTSDFDSMSQRDDLTTSPYYATGNARSILSNRISYFFDFHGPSATIDTACSSSLVALHQAVLSLRAGECGAACVAGVNLMLAPEQFVVESSLHMLSPAGHCHMWDTRADGYARGEGAAVLLLKPLSRALADGDASRIQGIIRETGVGSDGRTSGITMPSPDAQASLIRSTYRRAGLDITNPADRCQYFEAHGTGTPVGDPREAQAIHSAFFSPAVSNTPQTQEKLLVGSVKTVIGHTEGAAGLAGILKVMLAMKNAQVPPNLHMLKLNPTVAPFCTPSPSNNGHLKVVSSLQAWPQPSPGQPMRASVNSFGFGGTNAHAIMEHFDASIHTPEQTSLVLSATSQSEVTLPHIPLIISATSSSSLRALAKRYLEYLQKLHDVSPDARLSFQDVAWRTLSSRTLFIQRLSISANDHGSAIDALSRLLKSGDGADEFGVRARRIDKPLKLVGVFTGQGAQWAGMSKHLLSTSRIYREAIQSLDTVLQSCPHPPSWTITSELAKLGSDSRVKKAVISQPLCTALQVGLVTLLQHFGIKFACVVGHSSGEIGAAFAAGCISAKDAILIAYYRGLSVSHPDIQNRNGGMLAVGLAYDEAVEFCKQFDGRIGVAASNSPSSTTLSGDFDAVEEAEIQLKTDNVFARRLVVDKAYHSHHMANFSGIYNEYLAACQISPLHINSEEETDRPVWISSVYPGGDKPTKEQLEGRYWVDNMVKPVLFREAVERALSLAKFEDGIDGAIEVGPHSTLKGPFLDTFAEARTSSSTSPAKNTPVYTSLIRRGQQDDIVLQDFVGFVSTHFDPSPIKIEGLLLPDERDHLDASLAQMHRDDSEKLPSYVWDHSQIYYRQSRIVRQFHHQTEAPHELLGTRTRDDVNGCELRWRNLLRVDKLPWLAHHAFQGQPLFPASAYCIMALEATKALLAGRPASLVEIEDIEFVGGTPLEIDGPATEIMFSLMVQDPSKMATPAAPNKEKAIEAIFSIYATPEASDSPMRKRCSGRISVVLGEPDKDALPCRMDPTEQPETFPVPIDSFYDMMQSVGLSYSGPFEAIESLQRRHDFASASLKRFHSEDTTGLAISPATLDSCLQSCFATFSSPGDKALWTAFLPIHMKKITFNLAHKGIAGAGGPKRTPNSALPVDSSNYHVDAELTRFQEATMDSPSRIMGDILIYNDDGDMEVRVEALTVGSFASSDPSTDRELYLHTTYVADPEHSLVMGTGTLNTEGDSGLDIPYNIDYNVLEESCERVATFGRPGSAWPDETSETLKQHIITFPYSLTLEKIQNIAPADTMDQQYLTTLEEGRHASQFQRQLSKIINQIGHRYPRMSVFSLTDADLCLSLPIATGLGSAFVNYTSVSVGTDVGFVNYIKKLPDYLQQKINSLSLDTAQDIKNTLSSSDATGGHTPLDLVIVSTSIFKQLDSSEAVLSQIKELMRPGGFLLLVHMPLTAANKGSKSTVKGAISSVEDEQFSVSSNGDAMITPPDWPDLLEQSGFMNPDIKNTDQHYPGGFSITVRQYDSSFKKSLTQVLESETKLDEKVLIVAGSTAGIVSLASTTSMILSNRLAHDCTVVYGLDGLAKLPPATLSSFTSSLVLADLDDYQPVLSTLDEQRLDDLRSLLLVPDLTMLWVTKGARNGNAECAASYGFTRSIRAEMPSLTLQMLDFDHLHMLNGQLRALTPKSGHSIADGNATATKPLAASVIGEQFLQLVLAKAERERARFDASENPSHLWGLETEIYIGQDGHRLIPRMVPFAPGNDNFNASRRVVAKQVNTLSACLEVLKDANVKRSPYTTRMGPSITSLVNSSHLDIDQAMIKTFYSTPDPLYNGLYLCVGCDELSGQTVAAMAKTNASFLSVPRSQTVPFGGNNLLFEKNPGAFASYLAKFMLCQAICQRLHKNNPLVLIAPDDLLLECASTLVTDSQHTVVFIMVSAGKTKRTERNQNTINIHPRSTPSQLNSVLRRFRDGAAFVNFLPADHFIARHIEDNLANGCTFQPWTEIGKSSEAEENDSSKFKFSSEEAHSVLMMAIASAGKHLGDNSACAVPELVSLPVLLKGSGNVVSSPLVIDWRADRLVPHIERPLEDFGGRRNTEAGSEIKLRANRTYVLIGITRDMGQSLATLFVRQGARNIVLASRTAVTKQPQWAKKLTSIYGAVVRFLPLDVTDLAAVRHFRASIEKNMPMVGGVVNGAMVLDDRVFTHMTADTFSRVMRPKTVGSRNLDTVFRDDGVDADSKLDFFIMTSSFAAPGGHAGQSNYAAANMYMNGLAANRQRRGVAGSVLNIGVIYGLGFLHREKGELYAGLEREGYPPISERDLHHMFLEAIRQGRPKALAADRAKPIVDLTTGLSRYNPNQSADNALHWHNDPRFSHFTVKSDSSTDTGASSKDADDSPIKILADMISQATVPADVLGQQIVAAFIERLSTLLHLDGGSIIRGDNSLAELGVDSLVAVETRTWLYRTTGQDVPVMRILGSPSINKLCMDIGTAIVTGRKDAK